MESTKPQAIQIIHQSKFKAIQELKKKSYNKSQQ